MTKFRTSWTVIKAVIKFFFLLWLIHCLYFIYLFILCERHCFGLIAWMKFHFLSSLTVSFFSSSSSSFESFRIVSRSFCKQSVKLGIIVLDVRIRGSNPSKFVYIKWHSNSSILFLTLNWMNLIRIHYCWSYHSHIHIQTNQTKQKAFFFTKQTHNRQTWIAASRHYCLALCNVTDILYKTCGGKFYGAIKTKDVWNPRVVRQIKSDWNYMKCEWIEETMIDKKHKK